MLVCTRYDSLFVIYVFAIHVFLRSDLAASNPAIFAAAKPAVEALMSSGKKLNKMTLQQGLRPLLNPLGDYRKLTLPILQVRNACDARAAGTQCIHRTDRRRPCCMSISCSRALVHV